MNSSSFKIYNASAGSGKTFTLVKNYLKLLIASETIFKFKQVLAITFTNKAVAEMKTRIIEALKEFSDESILEHPNDMFSLIVDELNIEPKKAHEKSKLILDTIINNYAAFDISTIDGFTHKIIRTFAHDLKIPQNFEVELDTDNILNLAVDNLISKAGDDEELTRVLVDFAIEKTDDDKSWDISYDLNKIAKLLVNENHVVHLENLQKKTLKDFKRLKSNVFKKSKVLEQDIKEKAQAVLDIIDQNGLEHKDFSRGTLPNHFKKIISLELYKIYENKLQKNITERSGLYSKTLQEDKKAIIENLLPQIETAYLAIKKEIHQYLLLKNIHKNLTPLSVLNAINKELDIIKEDENLMLISEFNSIVSNEIKKQPAPFIYERIGEKFKHYFIDEFQDTSEMQWNNLKPLLENALTSQTLNQEEGSLMLVGDAKQAIYRWRGGKAEQFIDLFNKKDLPFPIEQSVSNLEENFRSAQEIVKFNNGFFMHLSNFAFNNPDYAKIYSESKQNPIKEINGYVNLSFLDYSKEDDKDDVYSKKVLETLENIIQKGYQYKDICVLVRKRKEGIAIANVLSSMEIPIISSETLLLQNSSEVVFILNMMLLALQPENYEVKIDLLEYIAQKENILDKHQFFKTNIRENPKKIFEEFSDFDFEWFKQLPIYDSIEYIIRSFSLHKHSNAYIQFFLDEVFNYSQKKQANFSGFLDYWNTKKESLSIVSPIGQNAVQIMTIHKAKGLEFPVVIFPYAELNVYDDRDSKAWFELPQEDFDGFDEAYVNLNKELESLNDYGKAVYDRYQSELELDNINLFYVALTRPIEQLYVIGKKDVNSKDEENIKSYSGLLINYLKTIEVWNDNQLNYDFGNPSKQLSIEKSDINVTVQTKFVSTEATSHNIKIITNSGYLWDTKQKTAIEKGNLIHNILSKITIDLDLDFVLNDFKETGIIDSIQEQELKEIVHKIINHPNLNIYFKPNLEIYNERDIITKEADVFRPDRVVILPDNKAIIIDYKTGYYDPKHIMQLQQYQKILKDMDLEVSKKILVYINDQIEVKEV